VTAQPEQRTPSVKVIQLISSDSVGGTQAYLRSIGPHFDPARTQVQIVNYGPKLVEEFTWPDAWAPFVSFPQKAPSLGCLWHLFRYLRRQEPDIVEIYGLRMNLVGRVAAKLAGVPVVISGVRNTDDWRKWYHVLADRFTSIWVDMYVSNSEAGSRICGQRERIRAAKRTVIHSGVELGEYAECTTRSDIRRSCNVTDDAFVFLTAATFRVQKAHDFLLRAIASRLKDLPRAIFLLAGDGDLRPEMESLALSLGVSSQVRFLGMRSDIPALLAAADAFVLVSDYEGLPRSMIEAMAAGLPVIGSTGGGIPELIEDGVTGHVVPCRDESALAEALVRLASDRNSAQQMGEAGRRRAAEHFSMEAVIGKIEALHRRLLSDKRRKTPAEWQPSTGPS
jgi:glycosyltransferase involved in cell wall biosynthesis